MMSGPKKRKRSSKSKLENFRDFWARWAWARSLPGAKAKTWIGEDGKPEGMVLFDAPDDWIGKDGEPKGMILFDLPDDRIIKIKYIDK